MCVDRADAVGPKQTDVVAGGNLEALLFELCSFGTRLAKASRGDHGSFDPTSTTRLENQRHGGSRYEDHRKVDRIGNFGDGSIHRPIEQRPCLGANEMHRSWIPAIEKVPGDSEAKLRFVGGRPYQRDAFWPKERTHRRCLTHADRC